MRYVVSVSFRARIVVILELGGAQTLQTVPLHRVVRREKLIDRQAVALAHLLNGDPATEHRCDDRGFPPRSSALGVGRRERHMPHPTRIPPLRQLVARVDDHDVGAN